ncbi:MAG: shikimate dehydrogenase [Candidatus Thorarchaeota archaeon]
MSEKNPITAKTKVLCLIGYPIEHSMSPIMHNAALKELNLDFIYLTFSINPKRLNLAVKGIKAFNILGFNVTMPFKQTIMKYLDEIEPFAKKIASVNTVKNNKGYLIGRNTDGVAAMKALSDVGYKIAGKNVLILGAGGASRAITYIIAQNANKIVIVNRTEKKAIKLANELKKNFCIQIEGKRYSNKVVKNEIGESNLLINATSIGLYPNIQSTPISQEHLHKDLFVYDLIYNPLETRLLKEAREAGCNVLGGLDMLVNQGALAFEWWTGKIPNKHLMKTQIIHHIE